MSLANVHGVPFLDRSLVRPDPPREMVERVRAFREELLVALLSCLADDVPIAVGVCRPENGLLRLIEVVAGTTGAGGTCSRDYLGWLGNNDPAGLLV